MLAESLNHTVISRNAKSIILTLELTDTIAHPHTRGWCADKTESRLTRKELVSRRQGVLQDLSGKLPAIEVIPTFWTEPGDFAATKLLRSAP